MKQHIVLLKPTSDKIGTVLGKRRCWQYLRSQLQKALARII
jgi:hypothetical protein